MPMDTKLFDGVVIFTRVVECGSFSGAAELTGHSTSYVSKEINKLESRLGVRLLNRTTRSIGLTPDGKVFFEQCQQLVENAEDALNTVNLAQQQPKGTLKISCPITFGLNYVKPLIADYMALYPEVHLDIDLSDNQIDVVQDGYDLAIRASQQLEDSTLISKRLGRYHIYNVASPSYIEKFGEPKSAEDLSHHRCVSYSNLKTPNRWSFIDANNKTVNVQVPKTVICNNADMEVYLTERGQGICRLPEFYIQKELNKGSLVKVLTQYQRPLVDVYAVYPSRKHMLPKVRSFIDLVANAFENDQRR